MYKFVLMSGRWYYTQVYGVMEELEDTEEHLYCGTVIAFCDNVKTFADEMGIDEALLINADEENA